MGETGGETGETGGNWGQLRISAGKLGNWRKTGDSFVFRMSSKHVRTDVNYAYPTAESAVMGLEGAVGTRVGSYL